MKNVRQWDGRGKNTAALRRSFETIGRKNDAVEKRAIYGWFAAKLALKKAGLSATLKKEFQF